MAEQKSQIAHAPITAITLPILHSWLIEAQGALRVARAEIDALNVFPVPDEDTGTNLYLTVEAACVALNEPADDLAQAAHRVGKAAILGATLCQSSRRVRKISLGRCLTVREVHMKR